MRGLDPRIHLKGRLRSKMDCRVKPGNDAQNYFIFFTACSNPIFADPGLSGFG